MIYKWNKWKREQEKCLLKKGVCKCKIKNNLNRNGTCFITVSFSSGGPLFGAAQNYENGSLQ